MAATSHPSAHAALFDIKSAQLPLLALLLRSRDIAAVGQALAERLADTPGFFDGEPVLIDASALADAPPAEQPSAQDLDALLALLREHGMVPLAVRGAAAALAQAAAARGLVDAPDAVALRQAVGTLAAPPPAVQEAVREVVREVVREIPAAAVPTLVIDKPLRSGQQVYARGGDLVVMAAVNPGAEVIADGNVHVYAPLRGKAIAGARGNTAARIFSTAFEPELVSIAGIYRTSEHAWAADVVARPAQVRLQGEKLVAEPL